MNAHLVHTVTFSSCCPTLKGSATSFVESHIGISFDGFSLSQLRVWSQNQCEISHGFRKSWFREVSIVKDVIEWTVWADTPIQPWLRGWVDSCRLIKTVVTMSWEDISNYFILIFNMSFASCSFSAALPLPIITYLACFFSNKNVLLCAVGHREIAFCQWTHNSRPQVNASYRLNVTDHACTRESQRCVLFLNVFDYIIW